MSGSPSLALQDSGFQALEEVLSGVQAQIVCKGVLATLSELENCRSKYKQLLSLHDLAAIKRYTEHFYSPLRLVALLCLEYRSTDFQQLLSACLQASRYSDLLLLVDQLAPNDPNAAPLAVLACYRLALWPELLRYAKPIKADALGSASLLMIARAHLEMGSPTEALARLVHIQPQTVQEERQLHILRLLASYRSGLFSSSDLRLFLSLFPNATGSERATLATLWRPTEVLLAPSELISSTLTVALRQFWHDLSQPAMLVDGSEPVPPLSKSDSIERLAFVFSDVSQLPIYDRLLKTILSQNNGVKEVHLLVLDPVGPDSAPAVSCESLYGLKVTQMLRKLRQLSLDVVVDTVGIDNSRWLEVLAQRVAALQICWVPPNLAHLHAPFYDALIVDRWTQPSEAFRPQVKLLHFSGLATLSHQDCLPKFVPREGSAPVAPIQLLLMGSPDQILPGTVALLREILALDSAFSISFLDESWSEPDLLETWWSTVNSHALPTQLNLLAGAKALESVDARCCIGLSLNLCSPTVSALQLISLGIPVVCLASSVHGDQSMRALLESLGLQAFVTDDPQHFLGILSELQSNITLRTQLSEILPSRLASSLVMDVDLFASDLLKGLHLLSNTP